MKGFTSKILFSMILAKPDAGLGIPAWKKQGLPVIVLKE